VEGKRRKEKEGGRQDGERVRGGKGERREGRGTGETKR